VLKNRTPLEIEQAVVALAIDQPAWGQVQLAEDGARPIIYYGRGATCWHPRVKGLTVMVNSIFNGWRMEDVWLDR
jgi:hypothetical protein